MMFIEFVGRGHDPADHVAVWNRPHSTKALTILLPTGGVRKPPYERQVLGLTAYYFWG